MKKIGSRFIVILLLLAGCTPYTPIEFDREVWLENNDVNDTRNPRARMTKDLLQNHLKPGLTKDSILKLLGPAYEDKIESRLAEGVKVPDSLHTWKYVSEPKKVQDAKLKQFNDWMRDHGQPDTLLFYPVGWSTIDPNLLVVKFNDQGIAYKFWVEQH